MAKWLLVGCLLGYLVYGGELENALPDLAWRNLGPYNMSGRVADVEGAPDRPNVVYVGSASGGIWKTTDGGLTFQPIFDEMGVASIGDLALAPSNSEVIYAGTGEANVRNSVSIGNGVYKSTDGGATWQHLGLEETRHISRIVVHPADPGTVHVGGLGHIFGSNEERGVFRSTDGGKSWKKVLYLDAEHGVSDMDQSLTNPEILFAGMWHFNRKPWTHTSGSEKGGLYRSLDGGVTWEKAGKGLPKLMGRIAVKIAQSEPHIVYVMAETKEGVLFKSEDYGATFRMVNDNVQLVSRGFYYTDLRVDPTDANRVYAIASRMFRSIDGGKSFDRISRSTHVDYHSLWINPENPKHLWQGQDGGVAVSFNGGETWEPIRSLPIAQFYQIYADSRFPFYNLGGGLQDNGTWTGPNRTREPAGILDDLWNMVSFGDAYFVVPHPLDPDLLLSEYQAGGIVKTQMRTRQQRDISPQPKRNDGGPVEGLPVRFNWNAPIVGSKHRPDRVYFAGSVVYRSDDFGDTWTQISPDLTTNDPEKQKTAGGPVWEENTTAEYHCTIISFAESPFSADVLWVGTDDGMVHMTADGGNTWKKMHTLVKGMPEFSPVSHLEPSSHQVERVYMALDRHMFDDYQPHVFVTENMGKSWRKLPMTGVDAKGWVWVVREDLKDPNLLYLGTEFGFYISYDRGETWHRPAAKNPPPVSVHDIVQHPVANDLILGTHGRGIWVLDDATPLQAWQPGKKADAPELFPVREAFQFPMKFNRYGLGDKEVVAPNPPYGAMIHIRLPSTDDESETVESKEKKEPKYHLKIRGKDGADVFTFRRVPQKSGLHRLVWPLSFDAAKPYPEDDQPSEFSGPRRGERVLPGEYEVVLSWDGGERVQNVKVSMDPLLKISLKDLKQAQSLSAQLKDKVTSVNGALKKIAMVEAQMKERKSLKKDADFQFWEPFSQKLNRLKAQLVREEGKPYWSQGPRLKDRLEDLMGGIDGGFAAPTAAQEALFEELRSEHANFFVQFTDMLQADLKAVQEGLASLGLPGLYLSEED